MIRHLMHLTSTRLDIVRSVGLCASFQSSLKESNLATTKMIIKYIARSYNLGLWCTNNTTLGFLYYTTLQKVDFTLGVASLLG